MSLETGWRDLAPELVEHILCKLPLWKLASMSATSRTFHRIFREQLHREQKARSDLALELFGHERIACIASLIERCRKGEIVYPPFDNGRITGWISADGKLHTDEEILSQAYIGAHMDLREKARQAIHERGDVCVNLWPSYFCSCSAHICVSWGRIHSQAEVWIKPQCKSVKIDIWPRSDGDLQVVALAQVLLSGGHGPTICYDGLPVNIRVEWCMSRAGGRDPSRYRDGVVRGQVSEDALQTQSAPLMPLASQSIIWEMNTWYSALLVKLSV